MWTDAMLFPCIVSFVPNFSLYCIVEPFHKRVSLTTFGSRLSPFQAYKKDCFADLRCLQVQGNNGESFLKGANRMTLHFSSGCTIWWIQDKVRYPLDKSLPAEDFVCKLPQAVLLTALFLRKYILPANLID